MPRHDGPGQQVLEADYAVGCDGGHSIVREQIGIARSGHDFDQLMVLIVSSARASCTRGWQALSAEVDLPRDASGL